MIMHSLEQYSLQHVIIFYKNTHSLHNYIAWGISYILSHLYTKYIDMLNGNQKDFITQIASYDKLYHRKHEDLPSHQYPFFVPIMDYYTKL